MRSLGISLRPVRRMATPDTANGLHSIHLACRLSDHLAWTGRHIRVSGLTVAGGLGSGKKVSNTDPRRLLY